MMSQTISNNLPEESLSGVLIDEAALTIDEFSYACAVERTWIVRHVHEGLLEFITIGVVRAEAEVGAQTDIENSWRFSSRQLVRARKLVAFERDFDANPEVAALLVDMLEEIADLKRRLSN